MMNWRPISHFFGVFRKIAFGFDAPGAAETMLIVADLCNRAGFSHMRHSGMKNIAAGYVLWQTAPERSVIRVREETARHLASVRLGFIPETPPASWSGNAFLLEATHGCLMDDIASILAYRMPDQNGVMRFWFVSLLKPDGIFVFSIAANLFRINEKMAKTGELLDQPLLKTMDISGGTRRFSAEESHLALRIIQFVFGASYYIENAGIKPGVTLEHHQDGPPKRKKNGKVEKKRGRPVPLWRYEELGVSRKPSETTQPRGLLDKDHLRLEPVIVSPHIRLVNGKVFIVDAYDSHRWRSDAPKKKKI